MNTAQEGKVQLTESLKTRDRWLVVIESVTYFAVILTAFLGNTLLSFAFYRTRTLRTPQNYYLVSLALTDILNAVACSITLAVLVKGTWPYGDLICQLEGVMISICASVSLLTLGMIAVNRYTKILSVCEPLQENIQQKKRFDIHHDILGFDNFHGEWRIFRR